MQPLPSTAYVTRGHYQPAGTLDRNANFHLFVASGGVAATNVLNQVDGGS